MPQLHRASKYAKWILEQKFPDVQVVTWIPDIADREYPILAVRNLGGPRDGGHPTLLAKSVIELTALSDKDIAHAEDLYLDALEALYEAQHSQLITPFGHISSIKETMGLTQFSSPFQATWRAQGLIQLGIRPLRSP